MRSLLPAAIAWRYLKAKKSHGAVSAIAIVSIVGVAVATAAIVCVLSVFNGFRSAIADRLDLLAPDVTVMPAKGKAFAADSVLDIVSAIDGVKRVMPVVSDNALAVAGGAEIPVTIKGVREEDYRLMTSLDSVLLPEGKVALESGETVVGEDEYGEPIVESHAGAVISIGSAMQLGIHGPGESVLLFAPRRTGRVNMANPMNSFLRDSVAISGIFQSNQAEYDEDLVITNIETARKLLEYEGEATSLEVSVKPGRDAAGVAETIQTRLGEKFEVKDRARMQEVNFRMVEIEKWVTFLLLFFILIIASFNIISTLSMLVLDKQSSLKTLASLGMTRRKIGAVFGWESIFVTLLGGLIGIVIGLVLSLLQQHYGFIRLAGDASTLTMSAYPVEVHAIDLLFAFLPVLLIGLLTAWIASSFARSRLRS